MWRVRKNPMFVLILVAVILTATVSDAGLLDRLGWKRNKEAPEVSLPPVPTLVVESTPSPYKPTIPPEDGINRLVGLPDELKAIIFKKLTTPELGNSSCVSQDFYRSSHDPLVQKAGAENWLRLMGIEKISLPGGTFQMGSPAGEVGRVADEKQHRVKVRPFQVADTKLTRAQWKAIMGSDPAGAQGRSDWAICPTCPVTDVSWDDAQLLIGRLKKAGVCARLPKEAEQEYYMRLGFNWDKSIQNTSRPFGDSLEQLKNHAWFSGNSSNKVQPVGTTSVPKNSYGMKDVLGNTWEWSQDGYAEYSVPVDNSKDNPISIVHDISVPGEDRVIRGCGWLDVPPLCRSVRRHRLWPRNPYVHVGFRLAFC